MSAARAPGGGRAAQGRIVFRRVDGATAVVGCQAGSPLQVLVPTPRGAPAWAVLVGHGGGLLSGDAVELAVEVGDAAAALLTTQAETKVYRAPSGEPSVQRLAASVAAAGVLAVVPDAVSPFADAVYDGVQRYELARGASLLALDAVVAGRSARGERWAFSSYRSRTEVSVSGELLLADALALAGDALSPPLARRLMGFAGFATAVLLGPAFAESARALLEEVAARPVERCAPALVAASPLRDGLLLRLAAREAGSLHALSRDVLAPALAAIGAAPQVHRW